MKTPEDFAEERTPRYDGPCPVGHAELTKWIKERDSEHSRRTELAREVLRGLSCVNRCSSCEDKGNCGAICCRARAALEALGEK